MTLNEVLAKQNFISQILLKNGDKELSKGLKVKVMSMRIEYGKFRKQLDEDLQEFIKGLSSDELNELQQKENRTEEEEATLKKLVEDLNESYREYVNSAGMKEVSVVNDKFTEDEYAEILDVNAGNDVEINGQKIPAGDFLEILHNLFFD